MRSIRLAGCFDSSRLAFGTGSLHHLHHANAERLLEAAAAHGFTHFDTAPLYGDGLAERWLGPLLRQHPRLTVATKVGMYPRLGSPGGRAGMLARKLAGKAIPSLARPVVDQTVARAERSLAESQRRLGRERVDILFIHEPDAELLATDEWERWQERVRDRVGLFGLAGSPERLRGLAGSSLWSGILQTHDSDPSAVDELVAKGGRLAFTYGHLSSAPATSEPAAALAAALARRPDVAAIVSTRRIERLAGLAELAS